MLTCSIRCLYKPNVKSDVEQIKLQASRLVCLPPATLGICSMSVLRWLTDGGGVDRDFVGPGEAVKSDLRKPQHARFQGRPHW